MPLNQCHNKTGTYYFKDEALFFLALTLLVASVSFGFSEGRLLSMSTTGHTVLFNLGTHDKVQEGEFGVVVKEIRGTDKKDLRLLPAARARNIKVSTDSSVWILYQIYDPELLVKGQKFLLFTESNTMRGRKVPTVSRTTIVAEKGAGIQTAKAALTDDKDRLSKLEGKYQKFAEAHDREKRGNEDFELIDLDDWEKTKNNHYYRSALYRSPHKEEFRKSYKLDMFHRIVGAYVVKINDPNFSYEKFYDDQMKAAYANEFRKKPVAGNEYHDFLAEQSRRAHQDAKLYRTILEKGDTWSEDFSDEDLRVVLGGVSELQEKDRRIYVVSKPFKYSFNADLGFGISDSQTDQDTQYKRGRSYALNFDIEWTPFVKHETLERYTISAAFRNNHSAFGHQGSNLKLDDNTVAFGINWYPLHPPYLMEAPLVFLGGYLRSGYASVEAPSTGQSGKYTAYAFPGFRGGMKWIFRNRIGLRIVASMESLSLQRYESNLGSTLPEDTKVFDAKVGFGLSYPF